MIRRRCCLIIILLLVPVLLVCSKPKSKSTQELLHEYIDAINAHDLERLASLTADSAVWVLGTYQLKGKDEILGPNALDAGANTRLKINNITVRGDTADLELTERNDILKPLGIDSVLQYPRFVFKDGLMVKKEQWKPNEMLPKDAGPNLGRFQIWIQNNRPDAVAQLFDSDGQFIFSRENGELMARLAREYSQEQE